MGPSNHVLALAVMYLTSATVQAGSSPQQALLPAVHWDHDKGNLENLVPVDSHQLYYTPDGNAGRFYFLILPCRSPRLTPNH